MQPSIFKLYSPELNKCFICNYNELTINGLYTHTELAQYYCGSFHHRSLVFSGLIAEFDRVSFWSEGVDTIWILKEKYPILTFEK